MPIERKQQEPEQQAGAPEWMVTFSDCMTLLLTFFVLLLSFSSFSDEGDFRKMNSSFAQQFSFGAKELTEKDAVTVIREQIPDHELQWGSEKPTLSQINKGQFKRRTEPLDFLRLNTFLVSSRDIFWGKGSVISAEGKSTLSDLASFLKEFPNHMLVVSESGPESVKTFDDVGFERSWAVCDYLVTEKGLDRSQFSISIEGTAAREYHLNNIQQEGEDKAGRILEIVFLRRSL